MRNLIIAAFALVAVAAAVNPPVALGQTGAAAHPI